MYPRRSPSDSLVICNMPEMTHRGRKQVRGGQGSVAGGGGTSVTVWKGVARRRSSWFRGHGIVPDCSAHYMVCARDRMEQTPHPSCERQIPSFDKLGMEDAAIGETG